MSSCENSKQKKNQHCGPCRTVSLGPGAEVLPRWLRGQGGQCPRSPAPLPGRSHRARLHPGNDGVQQCLAAGRHGPGTQAPAPGTHVLGGAHATPPLPCPLCTPTSSPGLVRGQRWLAASSSEPLLGYLGVLAPLPEAPGAASRPVSCPTPLPAFPEIASRLNFRQRDLNPCLRAWSGGAQTKSSAQLWASAPQGQVTERLAWGRGRAGYRALQ